ncbi:MAG TPA: heparinase II/III family protein [Phycisphaerae bacterium]|nr:heparinase II/III family protein [Phycisphaerae bacterium]
MNHRTLLLIVSIAFWLFPPVAADARSVDGVDAGRVREIAAMLPEKPTGLGRPIADRAAWESPAVSAATKGVVAEAEKLLGEPMPEMTDEMYLDYSRTGDRERCQKVMFDRRGRLGTFALAECVENKGRFVPAFVETLREIAKEKTWIYPAHDASNRNFKGEVIDVDLASVAVGWTLATADWVMGDKLPADARNLIREQTQRRLFVPFKDMIEGRRQANWWIVGHNNWNAVCLAGVTGSALALIDSREERAFCVAAAEKYSRHFLDGIPADGYCTEGVGYWNYGFGNYILLAETLLQATDGKVDLLKGEHVRQIAIYGLRIEIVPGISPGFADCAVNAQPGSHLLDYIARRWELALPPGHDRPTSWAKAPLYSVMTYLFPNRVSGKPAPRVAALPERTWFDKGGVLIGRPGKHEDCRIAVAMKGGHNAEEHNHNDVGSYLAVVNGKAVLVDAGAEVYTRRTFSEHRYDSKVINSFGHPVPIVAGKLQKPGREARGDVLRTNFTDAEDLLVLDVRSAYDVPELEKLQRTFVYARAGGGSLTIKDEVVFKSPQTFGTALITFGQWKQTGPGRLRVQDGEEAVDVAITAQGGEISIKAEEIHENLIAKRTPTRIGINLARPIEKGSITVVVTPAGK